MSEPALKAGGDGTSLVPTVEAATVHHNLSRPVLIEAAIQRREARFSDSGALVAMTGSHTGRAPRDKFIVEDAETRDTVAWGGVNRPIAPASYSGLKQRLLDHFRGSEAFVQDLWAGADPAHRLRVRVVTESAWHALFAQNMFIESKGAGDDAAPDFTILHAPSVQADPEADGTRSGTFIVVSFTERTILIGGTEYAGEIKKSIFGILNYLLPERGVLPMHCSANAGADGSVALFFGLSGTGKTTLSADASRTLIGDDEHGWSDDGVFNFEGGCYAKVIRLDPEAEPEIFAASNRFGAILENVVLDSASGSVDFDDDRHTENTRSSYPLHFIPNASATGRAGAPRTIMMLTADAFGVLPPISRLTPAQAMYHFLSGYTARVAGTEEGVTEPEATFSACFGAPFMPRSPIVYAEMLGRLVERHGTDCWLVNTGWTGGRYGDGARFPIPLTRAMVNAALDGRLAEVAFESDPVFGLSVPTACPGVPDDVLQPRLAWPDKKAYDATAAEVAALFRKNFERFEGEVPAEIVRAGIHGAG